MPNRDIPDKTIGPDSGTDAIREKTQAVVDLHIARRNLLIYPISHEQVKRSVVRSYKSLTTIIKRDSTVTLAVMKDNIRVGGQDLGVNNTVIKDLAGVLKHYEIATVTFGKGLQVKELARFLQLVCADHDKVMAKGGAAAIARNNNFRAIQIQAVDYSKLQVTDEDEIHRTSAADARKGSVWQQFVDNIMAARADEVVGAHLLTDPGYLAGMLNKREINIDEVVGHYRTVLAEADSFADGREQLTHELLAFQALINDLDSDLKAQFLSATFDNCGQVATISDAAHLVDGLGGDLIMQMLHQASSQKRKISPSLLAFVKKMGPQNPADGDPAGEELVVPEKKGFSSHDVDSLLAHEKYDTYVDDGYGKLLDDLTRRKVPAQKDRKTRTLTQQIEADLTPANVHAHVGRAITRLMIQSEDISGYRDWGRQMAYLLDDLVECGAYGYMTRVIDLMGREKRKQDAEQQSASIDDIISMLEKAVTKKSRIVKELAIRKVRDWTLELANHYSYIGILKKKLSDALGKLNHLNLEQKQKAWELLEQFLNRKSAEGSVTRSS